MSYRIAWVRFTKYGQTYPVCCHRRDLQAGDIVVVEMARDKVRQVAEVGSIEFLDWDCVNTILCKRSEWKRCADGEYRAHRVRPAGYAPETLGELLAALKAIGWREFNSTSRVWRRVLAKAHPEISGTIAIRARGIDFHAVAGNLIPGVRGRTISISLGGECRFVRNWYYHSEFDLFEHTVGFARELGSLFPVIDPFMRGIGTKQPPLSVELARDDLSEIRGAINGGMGPAYLSDGVWI